jgi:hypothetical protein
VPDTLAHPYPGGAETRRQSAVPMRTLVRPDLHDGWVSIQSTPSSRARSRAQLTGGRVIPASTEPGRVGRANLKGENLDAPVPHDNP